MPFLKPSEIKIGSMWIAADGGHYGCTVLEVIPTRPLVFAEGTETLGEMADAKVIGDDGLIRLVDTFKLQYRYKPLCLLWSERVPTVAGYYWSRDGDGSKRILELPHCGQWPKPWQQRRAETIAAADDDQKEKLAAIPDSKWRTVWAGPIPEPTEGERDL